MAGAVIERALGLPGEHVRQQARQRGVGAALDAQAFIALSCPSAVVICRPDGASGVASSGTPHDVATPEAGGAAGDAHAATGSAAGFADSADAGAVPPEGSGEETAAAAAGRPMPTEDASVGAGAAAAAGDDEIPRRPHGQRTVAPGGAHRNVPAADPHGFFGPGQRPGNPFDPYGPQGNNNFAFTAGFGFFPSLFGLQFQTFGIGSGAQSGNDAGRAGGGPGRDQPLSPEEQHQLLLSRVLLAVGCLVVLMLLFL
jgi:hypothetical protein